MLKDLQVRKIDGGVCFFGVVVGKETRVGKCPSVDVMNYHYSDLIRLLSIQIRRSCVVFGVANLFIGTGDIGVDFAKFGLFTRELAVPFVP